MPANFKSSSPSLGQYMLRRVLLVAGGASLLFGLLFLALYRDQLQRERAATSEQINRLLRVALENAMLKRDVPGLHEIVERMGKLPGISDVMILAPSGEVRFASRPESLGKQLPGLIRVDRPGVPETRFLAEPGGGEVLRSINPVPNQTVCVGCHGPLEKSPVNGILVVDYHAATIRAEAWRSAGLFALAGAVVLALTLGVLWRMLRLRVVEPLRELDATARQLTSGNLGVRAGVPTDDEPGRLAVSFNRMADSLVEQIGMAEKQQRYLQELLDGLPDGVRVIRQSDLRILAVNRAYCQQLGVTEAAAVGQLCHVSSHGRDRPCPPTMLICPAVELKDPGQSLKCRHRHRTASGREFPVEVHAVLVERPGSSGSERLIVESSSDLSDAARLSQEQRLSELGLLAAGIAHEIHNPLGSMRLAVDGLLRGFRQGNADRERVCSYLEMMNAEIDRCTGVTQRLLLLSRLPRQQPQIVPLNRAVSDTLQLLEFDAQSHGIVQHLELAPDEPRVLADDSDLRMVVLNLVQNAHHAMPQGGSLTVLTIVEDMSAVIEVRDTGMGISAGQAERIFDPFFSHRADGEGGTGLGLAICKSIVERYAGTIAVTSVYGQGAVFRVCLPLVSNS
jgi:signal transduction histidine kinase/HAMP domain-containing protein